MILLFSRKNLHEYKECKITEALSAIPNSRCLHMIMNSHFLLDKITLLS